MKKQLNAGIIFIILFSLILLSGCQNDVTSPTPSEINPSEVPEQVTETLPPVQPTQTASPKSLFFITNSSGNDPVVERISEYLINYSGSNGYMVQVSSSENDVNVRENDVVIFLENDTDKFQTASIQPNVTYIVYTYDNQSLSPDIFQIKQLPAEQVFLAGYISAMIADDWRIGGILTNQGFNNTSYEQIFKNGAHYLCGRCTPIYAPVIVFPITASVETASGVLDAYSELETNRVFVLYTPTALLSDELYSSLRDNKRLIVSDTPPIHETQQRADVYVYQDYNAPLEAILSDLNTPAKSGYTTKLTIQDNVNKLSIGKINYIQQVITNLETGLLTPFTVTEN